MSKEVQLGLIFCLALLGGLMIASWWRPVSGGSCCLLGKRGWSTPGSVAIAAAASAKLVEVGNKTCPVTGNPIGSMGPGVKYEYNGKIYNLCCPACRRTFDSDQAKYAQIAENDAARN